MADLSDVHIIPPSIAHLPLVPTVDKSKLPTVQLLVQPPAMANTFGGDEALHGVVKVTVFHPDFKCRAIRLSLRGIAKCRIRRSNKSEHQGRQTLISYRLTLLGVDREHRSGAPPISLLPGIYRFGFSMDTFPSGLPPDCYLNQFNNIKYGLRAYIDRPLRTDIESQLPIHISSEHIRLEGSELVSVEKSTEKTFLLNRGVVHLSASIPRSCYALGEGVPVHISLVNDSSKPIQDIKLKHEIMIRKRARSGELSIESKKGKSVVLGRGIPPGQSVAQSLKVFIPSLSDYPCTLYTRPLTIIHMITVTGVASGALDAHVQIPIIVRTVDQHRRYVLPSLVENQAEHALQAPFSVDHQTQMAAAGVAKIELATFSAASASQPVPSKENDLPSSQAPPVPYVTMYPKLDPVSGEPSEVETRIQCEHQAQDSPGLPPKYEHVVTQAYSDPPSAAVAQPMERRKQIPYSLTGPLPAAPPYPEDEKMISQLPSGWSRGRTENHEIVYLNHKARTVHRKLPPSENISVPADPSLIYPYVEERVPLGWSADVDEHGRGYLLDHIARVSHWNLPGKMVIRVLDIQLPAVFVPITFELRVGEVPMEANHQFVVSPSESFLGHECTLNVQSLLDILEIHVVSPAVLRSCAASIQLYPVGEGKNWKVWVPLENFVHKIRSLGDSSSSTDANDESNLGTTSSKDLDEDDVDADWVDLAPQECGKVLIELLFQVNLANVLEERVSPFEQPFSSPKGKDTRDHIHTTPSVS